MNKKNASLLLLLIIFIILSLDFPSCLSTLFQKLPELTVNIIILLFYHVQCLIQLIQLSVEKRKLGSFIFIKFLFLSFSLLHIICIHLLL